MIFTCLTYYNYISAMHRIFIPAGAIISSTYALYYNCKVIATISDISRYLVIYSILIVNS